MHKITVSILALIAGCLLLPAAQAHEFKVALLIPLLTGEGASFVQGFMMATTERDTHPQEHSDGHLGGLDVFVSTYDSQKINTLEGRQALRDGLNKETISIIVFNGTDALESQLKKIIGAKPIALLKTGISAFQDKSGPGVSGFIDRFRKLHGKNPSADAAQGYNAARRIDFAVRQDDSAEDSALMQNLFTTTSDNFSW